MCNILFRKNPKKRQHPDTPEDHSKRSDFQPTGSGIDFYHKSIKYDVIVGSIADARMNGEYLDQLIKRELLKRRERNENER